MFDDADVQFFPNAKEFIRLRDEINPVFFCFVLLSLLCPLLCMTIDMGNILNLFLSSVGAAGRRRAGGHLA